MAGFSPKLALVLLLLALPTQAYGDNWHGPSGLEPSAIDPLVVDMLQALPQHDMREIIAQAMLPPPAPPWQQGLQLGFLVAGVVANPPAGALGLALGAAFGAALGPRRADPWGRQLAVGEVAHLSLFRGELRLPSVIFTKGIAANPGNLLLSQILLGDYSLTSPLVHTSADINIAASYALRAARGAGQPFGYLYAIDATGLPRIVDLSEHHLRNFGTVPTLIAVNKEFLVPWVPPGCILWACSVDAVTARWGPALLNPNRQR